MAVQNLNPNFEPEQVVCTMKTASELKIFKSGEYEYIYIYWKQLGYFLRINTKFRTVPNQMTKELFFKSTVPDYEKKNDLIKEMKRLVDNYIT